ncbi:MAG: hypothetical protein ACI3Y5_02920 [Prevotella sp.]
MERTKEIIFDNLFSTLRSEYFGVAVEKTPMSAWKWRQVETLMRHVENVEPYSSAAVYHFVNKLQERRRQRIIDDERHAIDTSVETMNLLNIIVYNINHIERLGISLPGIMALGRYMRSLGDKVDFVKLDSWTSALHIRRMTSLMASILVQTMGFERNELPFLYSEVTNARDLVCQQLTSTTPGGTWSRSLSLYRFSKLGMLGFWQQKIKNMLDNIEE